MNVSLVVVVHAVMGGVAISTMEIEGFTSEEEAKQAGDKIYRDFQGKPLEVRYSCIKKN